MWETAGARNQGVGRSFLGERGGEVATLYNRELSTWLQPRLAMLILHAHHGSVVIAGTAHLYACYHWQLTVVSRLSKKGAS